MGSDHHAQPVAGGSRSAASVGKSRAGRAEEEGAEGFSFADDDEVGGSMRAMREQLRKGR
jgi:hypothetical protein